MSDLTDLIARLRDYHRRDVWDFDMYLVAADALETLQREVDHWKANHDTQVRKARLMIERRDMPLERVKAYALVETLQRENEALKHDIEQLQYLCGAAYQMAGVCDAPVRFLDALSNASNGDFKEIGDPLDLLPVTIEEFASEEATRADGLQKDAERWKWARTVLMSMTFLSGRHRSSETSISPCDDDITSEYWDGIADREIDAALQSRSQ